MFKKQNLLANSCLERKTSQKEGTAYSKKGLLCPIVPSLEMIFALHLLFDIPAGKGRVLNGDESLNYHFDEKSKSWRS